jgi:DNA-binding MarR family transcriptional regulator
MNYSCCPQPKEIPVPVETARAEEAAALLGAVVRLIRTSRSIGHRRAQALGPSGTPFAVLKTLAAGDARPGDLAASLAVSPSVISRALVPLEQHGLIERRHDAEDARAWVVTLSPQGHETVQAQHREYVRLLADAVGDWDLEDLRAATRALTRVEALFADQADALRQGPTALGVPALQQLSPHDQPQKETA